MSARSPEALVATLKRFGRPINPNFRDSAKDDALPDRCLRLLLHVRAPDGASWRLPMPNTPPATTPFAEELLVSELDLACVKSAAPQSAELVDQIASNLLMDGLNHGYGFDPIDFAHRPQKGFSKVDGTDAVAYVRSGHSVMAGVAQVTPDQTQYPHRKPPPPLETDIRTVTALHAIMKVRGRLLIVSSLAGPFAAIPLAMRIHARFDGGEPQPIFGFAITSLNPVTGEGIDLDGSPPGE